MKALITNSFISSIKPKDKAYDVWDTKLTGLILRVNPTGKHVYRCEYGRGKRVTLGKCTVLTPIQARDRVKEILADTVKGNPPQPKKRNHILTLNEFIKNEYKIWRYANRKSAKKDIDRLISVFLDEFGNYPLLSITPLAIDKWRSKRIASGIKPITANRDISILKSMLNKAEEWEIIPENPLRKFKLAKIDNSPNVRYLTNEEETNLKNALFLRDEKLRSARLSANEWRQQRNYKTLPDLTKIFFTDHMTPMILLSLNTGLRQGELFNLKWENINFERAILTIAGDLAKSGKTRHLPLNTLALQLLKNWKTQTKNNEFIFQNPNTNKPFDNVKKAWRTILEQAKIEKFRWHDMRHHFASKLVMAGVDLNTVRELLGHADIKMTLRYAHLAPEHKANAVEKLVSKFSFSHRSINSDFRDTVAEI